ncbi:MAG: hypothetical protein PHW04_19020, partial [Candidatus Wallbacteria bacterium]|nr:hypothetical protein [Candidatus Wallbacteria bacterium]
MKIMKRAFVLPVVLVLLLVLSMLGLYLNRTAAREYVFTYRSADHLRALYLAQGVIQATLAQVEKHMNLELRPFFASDKAAKGMISKWTDLDQEFGTAVNDLTDSLNQSDGSNIIDEGEFKVAKLDASLSESRLLNDQGTGYGDRTRRLSITATIEYQGAGSLSKSLSFQKKITQCFDVKVADVRPAGNQYVLMVSKVRNPQAEFNDRGGHLFVSFRDKLGESLGISIGQPALIDLYGEYFQHDDWERFRKQKEYDLHSGDTNSPHSLIPGWAEKNDPGPITPKGNFVADNEPWHSKPTDLKQPGRSTLNRFDCAKPDMSEKKFGGSVPHSKGCQNGKSLLDTGGGINLEGTGSDCNAPGIDFLPLKHPLTESKLFFNCGLQSGRTHLFYENCRIPSPIFGEVRKKWQA